MIRDHMTELTDDNLRADVKALGRWRIPNYPSKLTDSSIKRANKYLAHMEKRMNSLSVQGNTQLAGIYGDILMRRSVAFNTYCYNKANYGGYGKYSVDGVREQAKRVMAITTKKLDAFKVERRYLQKPNGKWRPIGVPAPADKTVLTGLAEILQVLLEPRIGNGQYGYRRGVSGIELLLKLSEEVSTHKMKAFQYDLKSFFNRVNVQLISGRVENLAKGLGKGIKAITYNTFPKIQTYRPEHEVEPVIRKGIKLGMKNGFTQGSPTSPILCNYALEFGGFGKINGLLAYVDDGIILSKTKELQEFPESPRTRLVGAEIAEKGLGYADVFTFLGVEFNTLMGKMTAAGKSINMNAPRIERQKFLKEVFKGYTDPRTKAGYGSPRKDSLVNIDRLRWSEKTEISAEVTVKDGQTIKLIRSGDKGIGQIVIEVLNITEEGYLYSERKIGEYWPMLESTLACAKLMQYMKEQRVPNRNQINSRSYIAPASADLGRDVKLRGSKVGGREPKDGATLEGWKSDDTGTKAEKLLSKKASKVHAKKGRKASVGS